MGDLFFMQLVYQLCLHGDPSSSPHRLAECDLPFQLVISFHVQTVPVQYRFYMPFVALTVTLLPRLFFQGVYRVYILPIIDLCKHSLRSFIPIITLRI